MTMAPIWALVTFNAAGDCLVDRTSFRASHDGFRPSSNPSFGADNDDDDDDDDFDDGVGGDETGDDFGDETGDDFGDETGDDFGDETGDDFGDETGDDFGDETGDDFGDEVGRSKHLTPQQRRNRRAWRHKHRKELALKKKNRALRRRLHHAKKGKIVQRNVTVTGSVATAVGQSMSVTLTPRTSLHLAKIFATGDTSATINTIISGDDPVVLDNLDAALISPTAYHGPSFGGRVLRAGVPVTINYTAGSTTTALKLSFYGRARVKSAHC